MNGAEFAGDCFRVTKRTNGRGFGGGAVVAWLILDTASEVIRNLVGDLLLQRYRASNNRCDLHRQ